MDSYISEVMALGLRTALSIVESSKTKEEAAAEIRRWLEKEELRL